MREIRLSGSEGGAAHTRPYPYHDCGLRLFPEFAIFTASIAGVAALQYLRLWLRLCRTRCIRANPRPMTKPPLATNSPQIWRFLTIG